MQVTVEKPAASLAKVSFVVPPDELEREIAKGMREVARSVRMKGFRPGKVPSAVLEKRFGEKIRSDVKEHFLRKAYQQALDEHELKPMTHPRIGPDDLRTGEDGGLVADFEVSLRPEVELSEYKGLRIESELEPVMDAHVESAIAEIKRSQSTPQPAGEEGIGAGGMVLCDVSFVHEGNTVLERKGLRLNRETPPPGVDPETFAAAIEGAKPGETIEVSMTIPVTVDDEAARGEPGKCLLVVEEAFDLVEPTDEELFGLMSVEDQAGLSAKVRERLEESSVERERARIQAALLDRLIGETRLELPEPLLEDQTENRLAQLAQRMSQQDVPEEEIAKQLEEQRATAREEAEKGLRALLIVEAIGEKEELLVTRDELETELAAIAERNEASVDEVREYYSKNNLGQQMAIELLERKVRAFLHEHAEIVSPG